MKKICTFLCFSGLLLLLAGADFTLFAVSDMHGALDRKAGHNVFRLAELIARERVRRPDSLLIDAGDSIQGSAEVVPSRGLLMIDAMNRIGFDVWVPGNHDFDYGVRALRHAVRVFGGTALGANIAVEGVAPWRMFRVGTRRVAVVGLTDVVLRRRLFGGEKNSVDDSWREPLRSAMRGVRASRPDFVVLVSHNGLYFSHGSVAAIAAGFPEIDLVIGAHSHQTEQGRRVGRTFFVQPGHHASHLAVIEVAFAKTKSGVRKIIRSRLLRTENIPADPKLVHALAPGLSAAGKALERRFGNLPEAEPGKLAARAMKHFSGADAACYQQTPIALPANASLRDFIAAFPYENRITILSLTPDECRRFFAEQRNAAKRGYRVVVAGEIPADKPRVRLAVSHYVASGGGTLFPLAAKFAAREKFLRPGPLIRDLAAEFSARR